VLPNRQREGIGSFLVRRGLDECRRLGHERVVVLGYPEYYGRLGFLPASRVGIRCEYDAPEGAFMVMELRPGAFSGCAGTAVYAPEFGGLE
jgi:putative acetyltransferase